MRNENEKLIRKSRSRRSAITISCTSYASAHHKSDTLQSSAHETCLTTKHPPPTIVPAIPEAANDDDYSAFTRAKSPTGQGSTDTLGRNVKKSVRMMGNEFRETSALTIGVRESQIPDEEIAVLALEAVTTRSKSIASTKSIVRQVNGLLQFYLDTRNETSVTLTGETSLFLARGYLESLTERGRAPPSEGKHARTVRPESLGTDWPLTNPAALSAAIVESNEEPKQAPFIALETAKAIEHISTNAEVCVRKPAISDGFLLMTYSSLRFADVQRLRPFEVNEDSIRGTLLSSKTNEPHGRNWPWAFPLMGITGATDWIQPILNLRAA